ncbi:MAG: hypothetical protein GEU79_12765 [Acidimicrobiia bacterium]|nr:hypothetical protein [Acidimicrobiia bacterium]
MMAGPLALLGGMEHLPIFLDADRALLDMTGADQPRVSVVPVASTRKKRPEAAALARGHWAKLGARVTVALPEHGLAHALEVVHDADVIVLTGGHPNLLVGGLGASPLWDEIVARWLDGAALSGSSAGAMAVFQWRIRLYPPDPLKLIPGLGLVHDYVAAPHFDRLRVRRWGQRVLHRLGGHGIIGIDEGTALMGHGDIFTVAGSGEVTVIDDTGMEAFTRGSEVTLDIHTRSAVVSNDVTPEWDRELALV